MSREITITGVKNKDLKKSLNGIRKALSTANVSAWMLAKEFNSIISGVTYVEDFKSLGNLAKHIGFSKSTISAYSNVYAVKLRTDSFAIKNELPTVDKLITVGQTSEIVHAIDVNGSKSEDLYKIVSSMCDMSAKEIREHFLLLNKEDKEASEETEDTEETVDVESTGESSEEASESDEDSNIGNVYEMPYTFKCAKKLSKKDTERLERLMKDICKDFGLELVREF